MQRPERLISVLRVSLSWTEHILWVSTYVYLYLFAAHGKRKPTFTLGLFWLSFRWSTTNTHALFSPQVYLYLILRLILQRQLESLASTNVVPVLYSFLVPHPDVSPVLERRHHPSVKLCCHPEWFLPNQRVKRISGRILSIFQGMMKRTWLHDTKKEKCFLNSWWSTVQLTTLYVVSIFRDSKIVSKAWTLDSVKLMIYSV